MVIGFNGIDLQAVATDEAFVGQVLTREMFDRAVERMLRATSLPGDDPSQAELETWRCLFETFRRRRERNRRKRERRARKGKR